MSWMDWEKIMEDISALPPPTLGLEDIDINAMTPKTNFDFGAVHVPLNMQHDWQFGSQQ